MDSPRDKPRRPGTFGDRGEIRRRTEAAGHPIHIDPELTPPPQEPPLPSTRAGYETIAPEIREQIDALAENLGTLTRAVDKVWDARKDSEQLGRIDTKLGTLAGYATEHHTLLHQQVWPAVKALMATVDELSRQMPALLNQVATMANMVTDVDRRLRQLEVDMRLHGERAAATTSALKQRLSAAETANGELDTALAAAVVRIGKLETKNRDEHVASTAISKRDKKLIAAAVAGGPIVTFIAAKWSWFTSLFH